MSVDTYYLGQGYTLTSKSVVLSGGGTHTVWLPKVGNRVVITSLSITSIDVAGTMAFYFDNGNDKIAMYSIAASGSILPVISGWESTVATGRIFVNKAAIQTDGIQINANGFEIPISSV